MKQFLDTCLKTIAKDLTFNRTNITLPPHSFLIPTPTFPGISQYAYAGSCVNLLTQAPLIP